MRSISSSLGSAILWATGIEVPLALLLALTGIPAPDHFALFPEMISLVHTPGMFLLESFGLCCGFGGGLVISDAWTGQVQHPSLVGLLVLAVANALILALLIFLGLVLLRGRKGPHVRKAAA